MAIYDALEALRRGTPRPLRRWFDPLLLAKRIAFVGATAGHFASIVGMQRLRQLNPFMAPSLRCFSSLQSTSTLLDELNAFAPTVIATYPTVAALLADLASQGALQFKPKEIWTGGKTLSPAVRRHVEQVLGCVVRNSYGASEFMSTGWACGHGRQVTLLPLALTTVLEDEAGVFDFQLRQQDDHTLVLRLDLQGAEAAAAAARCIRALEQFAVTQGLAGLRVLTELERSVPRGRSGKPQRIVAQVHRKQR